MQHLARRVLAAALFTGLAAAPSAQAQEPDLYDITKLRTFNLSFEQADWWDQLVDHKQQEDGIYIEADLEVDGILLPRVGVRFKGYSSYLFSKGKKKPFKWRFGLDASGSLDLPTTLPSDDSLPGLDLYLQVWCLDAQGLRMSNGLEIDVCQ